jgi:hypothetical protein
MNIIESKALLKFALAIVKSSQKNINPPKPPELVRKQSTEVPFLKKQRIEDEQLY